MRLEHFRQASRRVAASTLALLLVVGAFASVSEMLRSLTAIKQEPSLWIPGVSLEVVHGFGSLAGFNTLFEQQYSAPLDGPYARYLAPRIPRGDP